MVAAMQIQIFLEEAAFFSTCLGLGSTRLMTQRTHMLSAARRRVECRDTMLRRRVKREAEERDRVRQYLDAAFFRRRMLVSVEEMGTMSPQILR